MRVLLLFTYMTTGESGIESGLPMPNPYPKIRNRFDRRLIDRRGRTLREVAFAITCAEAGARYAGIQPGVPELGLEDLVMFNDECGSTCGLWVSQFSREAVQEKVQASNEKWAQARAQKESYGLQTEIPRHD